MQIVERGIGSIVPYENNPRDNESAVDAIAESIKEFGWQQPIVVDSDGVIVAGHTRYKAALRLGLESVPVVVADGLTPDQVRAYRLADNKSGEVAEWDWAKLDDELARLMDFDMDRFGFDAACMMDFEDFDGDGDGGGSRIANGTKVRVVIGPVICDIPDPDHEVYDAARALDPERVAVFIRDALLGGSML